MINTQKRILWTVVLLLIIALGLWWVFGREVKQSVGQLTQSDGDRRAELNSLISKGFIVGSGSKVTNYEHYTVTGAIANQFTAVTYTTPSSLNDVLAAYRNSFNANKYDLAADTIEKDGRSLLVGIRGSVSVSVYAKSLSSSTVEVNIIYKQ